MFRSSARQLSDSIFFSHVSFSPESDTVLLRPGFINREGREVSGGKISVDLFGDSLQHRLDSLLQEPGRQIRRIFGRQYSENGDTIGLSGRESFDFRNFLSFFTDENIKDDLERYFRESLEKNYPNLDFKIIQRDADWFGTGDGMNPAEMAEPSGFRTSFVPFGPRAAYSAEFTNARPLLVRSIIPQIGFSVFITCLILFSFFLIYRNMINQQRLIEQKNDFIGNVTHELKTPVATVGAVIEALKGFDVLNDRDKTVEYLDIAGRELGRLGMMTDKILNTSILDYGLEIRMHKGPVDLAGIIKEVISSFSVLSERKHFSIIFEQDPGSYIVIGNREHLRQMVYNLIENAIKHARGGREVRVRISLAKKGVELEVSDQGPGIPEIYRKKIFDKFFRIPSGNVHDVKGYGLGLNYVSGVVRSHGGSIRVENNREGPGANFIIWLPARPLPGDGDTGSG